jgi:hypothetical protein
MKPPKKTAKPAAAPRRAAPSHDGKHLIHDWNSDGPRPGKRLEFVDETLRDGLQCPSVTDPPIEKKVEILRLMVALGIQCVDLGLPGAGGVVNEHVETLLKVIRDEKLPIKANCAARTVIRDIQPVAEIQQRVGIPLAVSMFIGSSAIRQYAEDWTLAKMVQSSEDALAFAKREHVPITYVTEDTTRASPRTIRTLYELALDFGAKALIVCDTVGHATPSGVRRLVKFVKSLVAKKRSSGTATWTAGSASSTASRPSRRAPTACTGRGSASASAPATRRWTCCSSISSSWAGSTTTSRSSANTAARCRRRSRCRSRSATRSSARTPSRPAPASTRAPSSRR